MPLPAGGEAMVEGAYKGVLTREVWISHREAEVCPGRRGEASTVLAGFLRCYVQSLQDLVQQDCQVSCMDARIG